MNSFKIFFRMLPVLLILAGCAGSGLKIEGTARLDLGKGDPKPVANAPVVLLPSSPYTAQLEQKRNGFTMGQSEIAHLRNLLVEKQDSLKAAYVASNYQNAAVKTEYEALTDTLAQLKKESDAFKKEYITSVAKWLGQVAIAKAQTDENGKFHFESLEPGKYLLVGVYGISKQTGLLIKSIDISHSGEENLSIQNRDRIFYIDENDEM
ncbi:hypothetical protein Ctha_2437 [Chloroherpeton thalassium ATCC 35110]|uniref:Lipoprotein n=1 Tax=Chloroherpeton thalassium (strain ATCC 35110 / GB-78) TaxID=517418 RepID=B3QX76_CHLT3|nr:prealbumin-like fold domain-containing protein [Chloroherpeton thalassium]ACF14886.1 hypothetical protein Ctha_2437 [Chloroherpeton thalassium ATCC 35110]